METWFFVEKWRCQNEKREIIDGIVMSGVWN